MSQGHLVRFGHRQEMDMKGTMGFSSFGSKGKRGEWKSVEERGKRTKERREINWEVRKNEVRKGGGAREKESYKGTE